MLSRQTGDSGSDSRAVSVGHVVVYPPPEEEEAAKQAAIVAMRDHSVGDPDEMEATTTVYCNRWHILIMYFLLTCVNAAIWITFAPVVGFTGTLYNVTPDDVNWLSLSFLIAYTPGSSARQAARRSQLQRWPTVVGGGCCGGCLTCVDIVVVTMGCGDSATVYCTRFRHDRARTLT